MNATVEGCMAVKNGVSRRPLRGVIYGQKSSVCHATRPPGAAEAVRSPWRLWCFLSNVNGLDKTCLLVSRLHLFVSFFLFDGVIRLFQPVGIYKDKYEWAGSQEAGDCSLLIKHVTIDFDDGEWECQVTASEFTAQDALTSTPVRLVVRGKWCCLLESKHNGSEIE